MSSEKRVAVRARRVKGSIAQAIPSAKDADEAVDRPPSIQSLLFDGHLHEEIKVDDSRYIYEVVTGSIQVDAYCIHCAQDSIFKRFSGDVDFDRRKKVAAASSSRVEIYPVRYGYHFVSLTCQRRASHVYTFAFFCSPTMIKKIGQDPTFEDISGAEIARFRSVLDNLDFRELRAAGGLASHNLAVASYVYLRRIFERLIQSHHAEYGPVEGFDGMRMDDKIKSLSKNLPEVLVKNAKIYGILSSGIHELTEEQCVKHFPVLRAAIIAILEEDLQRKQEKRAAKDLEAAIASIIVTDQDAKA